MNYFFPPATASEPPGCTTAAATIIFPQVDYLPLIRSSGSILMFETPSECPLCGRSRNVGMRYAAMDEYGGYFNQNRFILALYAACRNCRTELQLKVLSQTLSTLWAVFFVFLTVGILMLNMNAFAHLLMRHSPQFATVVFFVVIFSAMIVGVGSYLLFLILIIKVHVIDRYIDRHLTHDPDGMNSIITQFFRNRKFKRN